MVCRNTAINTLLNSAPLHDLIPPPNGMKFLALEFAPKSCCCLKFLIWKVKIIMKVILKNNFSCYIN